MINNNENLLNNKSATAKSTKRSKFAAIFIAIRPHQWIKNLLLFSGVIFDAKLPTFEWITNASARNWEPLISTVVGFVIFCLLSSSVYLINDICDYERDRVHPKKRLRPIASGEVHRATAVGLAIFLMVASTAIFFIAYTSYGLLSFKFGLLSIIYLIVQFAYIYGLKNIFILDVFLIASGFVIRAMAGAAVCGTFISPWLIICTGMLSLLIGFGKRRHELTLLGSNSTAHRETLEEYSPSLIDQLVTICAAGTIVAYSVYAVQSYTAWVHHHLYWTTAPVAYGVFRYVYLLHKGGVGGAPEKDLFTDKHILASIIIWAILSLHSICLPNWNLDGLLR